MPGRSDSVPAIPQDGGPEVPAVSQTLYALHAKRAVDLLLAWAALVCCLPMLLVLGTLISVDSPGGALYRQTRAGVGGRRFEILKLRTMYTGADARGFRTADGDYRVTRFGKFLRDTKLDELPQLWNIIRNDMSMIGPRPLSTEECEFLTADHGFHPGHPGFYPLVSPGLTGLEQIYRIHPLSYEDRFRWNDLYESRLSLWLDLRIFATTIVQCRLVCMMTAIGGILELATLLYLVLSR